jgi:hypothetical protein
LRAAIRVEGAGTKAWLWIRGDRPDGSLSFIDTMQNQPITTSEWSYCQLDSRAAEDSASISFGFLVAGSGKVWVDDASFNVIRSDPPEAPRALTETGLANLTAFARLLGAVRHFHPSDRAAQTDWDAFAILGVRVVEGAATAEDLAATLRSLFEPIAPTIRIFPTGRPPELPSDLRPPSAPGLQMIRWNHYGVGLRSTPWTFHSERVSAPVAGAQAPAGFLDPAQPYQAEIGRGLSAWVPLSLYADAQGTLPHASSPASSDVFRWVIEDRATRLGGVILAWSVVQNFYPYFDVVSTDWPAALATALASAATDSSAADYQRTFERLVAAQKDGHGYVWWQSGAGPAVYNLPLVWDWVEGQLVLTRVMADAAGLGIGDRVLRIDGRTVEQVKAETEELVSGATPQWVLWSALPIMAQCNGRTMQLEVEPWSSPGTTRTVELNCGFYSDWSEPRPGTVQELEPGILYVDLVKLTDADWAAALPSLQAAKGIVFDLRGYPLTAVYLQHLTRTPLLSEQFIVPSPLKPDRVDLAFTTERGSFDPLEPYLTARRVFLTDGRAYSGSETVMAAVEAYKLAEIVGAATAGTNGTINYNDLPAGFRVTFTGVKTLKQYGSQHHGVGIHPTIPATRTRRGIAALQDEVLLRGLEVVKWPAPGPTPAITAAGVVNAANFAGGAVAPGEMVTIFGSDLGPTQIALASYQLSGYLARSVGDAKVFFDDVQAPIVHAVATQVTAIVPYKRGATTRVRVEVQGRSSNEVTSQWQRRRRASSHTAAGPKRSW